jgi:anaerobic magnesium-protoporphyrin IX monomethyl ester cyclase
MILVFCRPYSDSLTISPPLGIAYISSFLKSQGHECHIVDSVRDDERDIQKTVNEVVSYNPDIVGTTCVTASYFSAVDLTRRINKLGIPTVLGGVHVSSLPEQSYEESGADWIVTGEGESAMLKIINGHPKGIVCGELADVRAMPWPDWDEVKLNLYPHAPFGGFTKRKPVGTVMTTRGCPYKCTFCAAHNIYGGGMRWRDPLDVVDEMEYLVKYWGMREINIADDNFTVKKSHAMEVCEELMRRKIDVVWACENGVRADRIDEELLRTMKKAGCYKIAVGVESPNPVVLESVQKGEKVSDIEKAISTAKRVGLHVRGCFIVGLPGETKETLHNTALWARNSKLDEANFTMLDVLPGTKMWDDLQGKFKPDWNKKSFKTPEYIPEGLTKEDLIAAQREMFRMMYTVPSRAWGVIKRMRLSQIKVMIKRLVDFHVV